MLPLIASVLALIQQIVPTLTAAGTAVNIIKTLVEVVPLAVKEAKDLVPEIKGIIVALQSKSEVLTADDIAQLEALNAAVDAPFDQAAAKAELEDAAADAAAAGAAPATPAGGQPAG